MAVEQPALATQQPWKAVVENDRAWMTGVLDHAPELIRGVTQAYANITIDASDEAACAFFATATHPSTRRAAHEVGYRTMRELISLQHPHEVTAYIHSPGGRDLARPVSRDMYGRHASA